MVDTFETTAISEEINLADVGLREGEKLDPYIEQYLEGGVRVIVPSGQYVWDGDGLDNAGPFSTDCELIGEGMVTVEWDSSEPANTDVEIQSGTFRMRNFTFRGMPIRDPDRIGRDEGPSDDHRMAVAASSGAVVEFINVHMPEGAREQPNSEAKAWRVSRAHDGTARWIDCSASWWGNNAWYASSGGKDGTPGRCEWIRCFGRNNNIATIRTGSGPWLMKDCVIVNDAEAPHRGGGGHFQRGVRFDEPGGPGRMENVHITTTAAAENSIPIRASDDSSGAVVEVQDLFIRNDLERDAIALHKPSTIDVTGDNVHVTGSGDLDVDGGPYTNLCQGSGCQEPTTEPMFGSGDFVQPVEIEVEGRKSNPPPAFDYEIHYIGELEVGHETESFRREELSDGTKVLHSSWSPNDAIYDDNFWLKGQWLDFKASESMAQIRIQWDDSEVAVSDLPLTSPGYEPPEEEPPEEPEPEPPAPDPIPDRAQIAITGGDATKPTSYIFQVNGEVSKLYGFETSDVVETEEGVTVIDGVAFDKFDGFDHTGCIRSFAWTGPDPTVYRDGTEIPLDEVVDCDTPDRDPFIEWLLENKINIALLLALVGGMSAIAKGT